MLSLLIDTDVFLYGYIQLTHMYKQLYTIKNRVYAGGGYNYVLCNLISYVCLLCSTYEYMNSRSYMIHMNICSCVHMLHL